MTVPVLQTILLIEDEPDIQMVARVALESVGGFTVEVCGTGEEALARAPDIAPDLILLDVMMPGMDGLTTLRALRACPPLAAVPVIFMTAKVQSSEIAQYKALGALDVIGKPFDPMKLASAIKQSWARHFS